LVITARERDVDGQMSHFFAALRAQVNFDLDKRDGCRMEKFSCHKVIHFLKQILV
jgi:hypothetical protein